MYRKGKRETESARARERDKTREGSMRECPLSFSHDVEFSHQFFPLSSNCTLFRRGCLPLYSTGQRKNYGFVTFETEEALMRAVSAFF